MRRKEEEDKKGGINTVQAVPKALQAGSTRTAPRERKGGGRHAQTIIRDFPQRKRDLDGF